MENIHQNLVKLSKYKTVYTSPVHSHSVKSSSRHSTDIAAIRRVIIRYILHNDYYEDTVHQYSPWSLTEQLKAC